MTMLYFPTTEESKILREIQKNKEIASLLRRNLRFSLSIKLITFYPNMVPKLIPLLLSTLLMLLLPM